MNCEQVELYDPATDAWQEVASLPAGRHHLMAVGHNTGRVLIGEANFLSQ